MDKTNCFSVNWKLSDIKNDKAITVFSCFSCCGGSTLGYKRAGFNVIGNLEIDPEINKIYVKNNHPKFNYNMDIRDFKNLNSYPNELMNLDILDGSPPCTTFSTLGEREKALGKTKIFHEGQKKQRLDDLFFEFIDVAKILKPKIVVAENVIGMLNNMHYIKEISRQFKNIGYNLQIFKLDAKFMDVPQQRNRLFFIANRMNYPNIKFEFNHKVIVYGDIKQNIQNRKILSKNSKVYNLIKNALPGESLSDVNLRIYKKTGYFSQYLLDDNKPLNCITTGCANNFYRRDFSYISNDELLLASTFPQDYDFGNKFYFAIGMCVPPNMMANIATEIWQQWLKKEQKNEPVQN